MSCYLMIIVEYCISASLVVWFLVLYSLFLEGYGMVKGLVLGISLVIFHEGYLWESGVWSEYWATSAV